jgi:hypothetical protein
VSDPLFNSVGAQLRFDEANGATTFVDSSRHGATVSRFGSVVASDAQSVYGGTSALFPNDAGTNYLTITGPQIVTPGSQEVTMECWVFPFAWGGQGSEFATTTDSFLTQGARLGVNSAGGLYGNSQNTPGSPATASGAIPLNQWTHVCFVNEEINGLGRYLRRLFINGVSAAVGSEYVGGAPTTNQTLRIGYSAQNLQQFRGYIDDFRFTAGVCRYRGGASFTPQRTGTSFLDVSGKQVAARPTLTVAGPTPAPNWRVARTATLLRDTYDGGFGRIIGTVKEKGMPSNLPLARRVRLFHELTGRFLRETWSDATTGNYAFVGIDPTQRYTVVSYDYTGSYRAVIADNLLPETYTP